MKKRLLAITGKRFSGKDTLAALLVARAAARGLTLETCAFAAESKRMFVEQNAEAVDLERLLGDREYKEHWRPQLTAFTMEALAQDPLVFCRRVADRIALSPHAALVTDVRLRLDVEHLRARFDLHLVRIARSDDARAASGWTYAAATDGHETETQLDDVSLWDEIIENDGSLVDLGTQADALIARALSPRSDR